MVTQICRAHKSVYGMKIQVHLVSMIDDACGVWTLHVCPLLGLGYD
jgi:hypothetical protein